MIRSEWPDKRKQCPPIIQGYRNHRDRITEIREIMFKRKEKEKIIVLTTLGWVRKSRLLWENAQSA